MVKAPTGSRDIVNFVSCFYKGLGFLKLADIVLILINPSPCYVKNIKVLGMTFSIDRRMALKIISCLTTFFHYIFR